MVTRYEDADDLASRFRAPLESVRRASEEVVFGIDVYTGPPLAKRRTPLVLTSERILVLNPRRATVVPEAIDLDAVESVRYREGRLLQAVVVEGEDVGTRRFRSVMGHGEEFADRASSLLSTDR